MKGWGEGSQEQAEDLTHSRDVFKRPLHVCIYKYSALLRYMGWDGENIIPFVSQLECRHSKEGFKRLLTGACWDCEGGERGRKKVMLKIMVILIMSIPIHTQQIKIASRPLLFEEQRRDERERKKEDSHAFHIM